MEFNKFDSELRIPAVFHEYQSYYVWEGKSRYLYYQTSHRYPSVKTWSYIKLFLWATQMKMFRSK